MLLPLMLILCFIFLCIGVATSEDYPTVSFSMVICTILSIITLFIVALNMPSNYEEITTENFNIERKTYIENEVYKTKFLITLENGDILITDKVEITNKNELIYKKNIKDNLDYSIENVSINSDVATEIGLLP